MLIVPWSRTLPFIASFLLAIPVILFIFPMVLFIVTIPRIPRISKIPKIPLFPPLFIPIIVRRRLSFLLLILATLPSPLDYFITRFSILVPILISILFLSTDVFSLIFLGISLFAIFKPFFRVFMFLIFQILWRLLWFFSLCWFIRLIRLIIEILFIHFNLTILAIFCWWILLVLDCFNLINFLNSHLNIFSLDQCRQWHPRPYLLLYLLYLFYCFCLRRSFDHRLFLRT